MCTSNDSKTEYSKSNIDLKTVLLMKALTQYNHLFSQHSCYEAIYLIKMQ